MNGVHPELANLSLTEAELVRCRPVSGEGGRTLRALCPFHGSDHQRSLRVARDTGRFSCFACGAWGYLEESRDQWRRERPLARVPQVPSRVVRVAVGTVSNATSRPAAACDLERLLASYQAALAGSWGEAYLQRRRIPLEVARRGGVGYAAPGTWAHRSRDWKWGRLVFPHTDPQGQVVNLYGRAVGSNDKVPKNVRHDHLPGPKGYFRAEALRGQGAVFVCEGPFDALSLMAAGHEGAVAIYGVDGCRWSWAVEVSRLVFAMDADQAGEMWRVLARAGRLRGKDVSFLPTSVYARHKDVSEAWMAGCLGVHD